MADQGIWFKLWCAALDDPTLDNLPIADFGRWAKFGAFLKRHGTNGTITLSSPCRSLCSMLQVPDFAALCVTLSVFPNVNIVSQIDTVTGVTNVTVTIENWQRYQGDNSLERVRKFRARVTAKKRREEKREEEKKTPPKSPSKSGDSGPVKAVIDHWYETYKARFKATPPVNGAKAGAIAKNLLRGRSLEEAKWLITEHITNPTEFFESKCLYGLEHVLSDAPKLLARRASLLELRP